MASPAIDLEGILSLPEIFLELDGINDMGLSYDLTEERVDCFSESYASPDDLKWSSLQALCQDSDERDEFFCVHSSKEEKAGQNVHESAAKGFPDWAGDFFDKPYLDLLHTSGANLMAPSNQGQKRIKLDTKGYSAPNFRKQSLQSDGSMIAHSSSTLPSVDLGPGEPWNCTLQRGHSILSDVDTFSTQMANEEYTNRLFSLIIRMQQSELSRLNAVQSLETSMRNHGLDSELQQSRSNFRQLIQYDCENVLSVIANQSNSTDPVSQNHLHFLKLRVQCLLRLLHASNSSDDQATSCDSTVKLAQEDYD